MKIGEAKNWLKEQLKDFYDDDEASNIASLVLEEGTGFTQQKISLYRELEITSEQHAFFIKYIKRLQQQEPIQYIMNKTWFYGMELYVDKAVLIPRPETEELVDWILNDIKANYKDVFEKSTTDADATTQLKILDIGTGSGCIALALKKNMPKAEVWGCDISEEALNVARRNGSALDIRVDFQGIDFLVEAQQKSLPTVNIIVSNPPYIPANDKKELSANVVAYEPHAALFVPNPEPLLFYKAIVHFARKRLYENGSIYLEINENAGQEIVALFSANGYKNITLKKDMQGKDRMIKATLL